MPKVAMLCYANVTLLFRFIFEYDLREKQQVSIAEAGNEPMINHPGPDTDKPNGVSLDGKADFGLSGVADRHQIGDGIVAEKED